MTLPRLHPLASMLALALSVAALPQISQAAVMIEFELSISGTNPGPFTSGALLTGSLTIDESVSPSGSGTFFQWAGAADDLSISIDDPNLGIMAITGSNGDYSQQELTGSTTSLAGNFNPNAGSPIGSLSTLEVVNPAKNGAGTTPFVLQRITFAFRVDKSLVASNSEVVSAATLADFGFLDLTLYFDHPTAGILSRTSINRASSFQSLTFSSESVPAPSALGVAGLALLGLRCRRL